MEEVRGSEPCRYLGKNSLVKGNSQCDGLKMEVFLACLRSLKEASMAGIEGARGQRKDELREAMVAGLTGPYRLWKGLACSP